MSRIATQQDPSSVRLSFVPDGVVGSLDRTLLGTHGESVEKALRKHLSGQVEPEKLKGILFGVDMQGAQAGSGRVGLLIETAPSVRLTPRELELINDRLQDALSTVNNDLVSQGERGRYITAGIVSKPGPVR